MDRTVDPTHYPYWFGKVPMSQPQDDFETIGEPGFSVMAQPEQLYGLPNGIRGASAEAALMRAVLCDALNCFRQQFRNNSWHVQRLAREAETWFFVDNEQWPFSFVNICAALGLNPQGIRRQLRRYSADARGSRLRRAPTGAARLSYCFRSSSRETPPDER